MGRPVAAAIAPWLAKPAAKRGLRDARLLVEWGSVVGPELAGRTRPEKLDRRGRDGILRLTVAPGWALEVQHLEPLILQRINQFFGAQVVTRLALKQGPVSPPAPATRAAPPQRQPPPGEEQALADACAAVEDRELAAILQRLGRSVLG
jgi:hypothetical protein